MFNPVSSHNTFSSCTPSEQYGSIAPLILVGLQPHGTFAYSLMGL